MSDDHYYAVLLGNGGRPIFFSEADKQNFGELVARAAARHAARVHAFCWIDNEARLTIQVTKAPLGRLVQMIAAQHARAINRASGRSGYVFQHPYRSIEVPGPRLLLDVVRHIHLTPLQAEVVAEISEYRWSSHPAYLGLDRVDWLTTQVVFDLLHSKREEQLAAYQRFMASAVNVRSHVPMGMTPHQAGDRWFFNWLRKHSVVPPSPVATVEQITRAVTTRLGVEPHLLASSSRVRALTLARALIAWHCVRNDIATLTEVSQRLGRTPSTIHSACERLRERHPGLFREPLPRLLMSVVSSRS